MLLTYDEILQRVQSGKRAAYMELFERHDSRIEGTASWPIVGAMDMFERHDSRIEGCARWQLQDAEEARNTASGTLLRTYQTVDQLRHAQGTSYLGYLLLIWRCAAVGRRSVENGNAVGC